MMIYKYSTFHTWTHKQIDMYNALRAEGCAWFHAYSKVEASRNKHWSWLC